MMLGQGEIPNIGTWTEYGLAGMVIAALFATLFAIAKMGIAKFEVIDARHDETVKMLDANHREERREWQADAWRREEQLQQTISGLTDAVEEINKRQ